jgi:hypothetical protein
MNTERTPDQIAAELYPITAYKNMWEEAVIKRERAAWLSRQSEVDELKRQVDRAEIRVLEHMVLWENSKNGTLAFEYIAVRDQLNAKENEITELKRQVEELMAFNETCLQNNKSLTAAKEKELEDLKRQMDGMEKKYLDALDYKDQIHIDVVKDLTNELAAKEKEMEDWKTIANVYKERNNELTDPPQIQNLNKQAEPISNPYKP